jgi:hypothetical protein
MDPNLSEFSYGYAITDELINWHGEPITAAPVFPSLYAEGQSGGGYDVLIDRPGVPLFLQFKLSHHLRTRGSKDVRDGLMPCPHYRMYLRPSRYSDQHEMLIDLEAAGNEVYYSAPAFHQPTELNDAYLNHQVKDRSVWVKPSWIGPLPDDKAHYVTFCHPGDRFFRSAGRNPIPRMDAKALSLTLQEKLRADPRMRALPDELGLLADQISIVAEKRRDIPARERAETRQRLRARRPIEQIAFYSQVYLDAQFFIVQLRE